MIYQNWQKFSFVEQMANVGSEVERAIVWREKKNKEYSRLAFERALELLILTIDVCKNKTSFKELTRIHEFLVDYFVGRNQFSSSSNFWRKYFLQFNFAVNKNK